MRKKTLEAPPQSKRAAAVTRADGRTVRRMTVYLPVEVARQVAVRCAEIDVSVSDGLTAAAEAWLRSE